MLGIVKDKGSERLQNSLNSAFSIFRKKPSALGLWVPLLPFLYLQQSRFCCGDLIPLLLIIIVAAVSIKQKQTRIIGKSTWFIQLIAYAQAVVFRLCIMSKRKGNIIFPSVANKNFELFKLYPEHWETIRIFWQALEISQYIVFFKIEVEFTAVPEYSFYLQQTKAELLMS